MEKQIRAHAVISGRVQGVFFRMERKMPRMKPGFSDGFARNGTGWFEAMFGGLKRVLCQFLNGVKKGPPIAKVTNVDVHGGTIG